MGTSEPVARMVARRWPFASRQHVGAAGAQVLRGVLGAQRGEVLPGQREDRGLVLVLERQLPALRRLDRVGRAQHQQARDRPQGRQVLDRLVRRPVLAEPDRVVGADDDHPLLHERGEADRGPAVVGEDEEGAAVGDDAAVQRHPVHRRHHAVLADAVADVAPGVVAGVHVLGGLGVGVVRVGEVGRAADHRGHGLGQHLERRLARLAGRHLGPLGRELALVLLELRPRLGRKSPARTASNSARFSPSAASRRWRQAAAASAPRFP